MKNDYRNTIYWVLKKNIVSEKDALEKKIKAEHPRTKIIYNQIKKKIVFIISCLETYTAINVHIVE